MGLVHEVAAYLLGRQCNIVDNKQFGDHVAHRFFMRVQFEGPEPSTTVETLRAGFAPLAAKHRMQWQIADLSVKTRTMILVSRHGHCLADLLYRASTRALNIEVPLIVSNHNDLANLANGYGIQYEHISTTGSQRGEAETALLQMVEDHDIQLVVLARYMQVLSADLCQQLVGRAINIHHSFLPGFKGARPYDQAFNRGVKLIGATAHYVTAELDDGPIIEQEVTRVDHTVGPEELALVGKDIESSTLARAVRWHTEHRVLLNGGRTVVFR
jgi:formyltetrahydrofolate deformylase